MVSFATRPHVRLPADTMSTVMMIRVRAPIRVSIAAPAPPPTKPPGSCSLGGYCVKASCDMLDVNGNKIGKVDGFDTMGDIAERVQNVCNYKRSSVRGQTCSDVQVTLLASRPGMQCSGQIFYELVDGIRKLV